MNRSRTAENTLLMKTRELQLVRGIWPCMLHCSLNYLGHVIRGVTMLHCSHSQLPWSCYSRGYSNLN